MILYSVSSNFSNDTAASFNLSIINLPDNKKPPCRDKVVFGAFSFQYDRALSIVDCGGSFDGFGGQVFTGCSVLKTLILRPASLVSLGNINNFNSTPFASGGTGGTLYVPQSLISSYQSATNWSTILGYANNQILPIEGSIYETQYADGTPIE